MSGRFALIIGNSNYTDTTLAQLQTPQADATGLADVLRRPTVGAFDDVQVLTNASSAEARAAIARFFSNRKRDDLLLLYFSGHGVLDRNGQLFLATPDTDRALLRATAIPARFITDELDHSRSRRQVLVLDCCHSGAFARGAMGGGIGRTVGTGPAFEGSGYGRIVLTATDATQYAWEENEIVGDSQWSVFTHHMIEGLSSGAADMTRSGRITVDVLFDYVRGQILSEPSEKRQSPEKWAYRQDGDIVLAQSPFDPESADESSEPTLLEQLETSLQSSSARVRLAAVEELSQLHKIGLMETAAYKAMIAPLSADEDGAVASRSMQLLSELVLAERSTSITETTEKAATADWPANPDVDVPATPPITSLWMKIAVGIVFFVTIAVLALTAFNRLNNAATEVETPTQAATNGVLPTATPISTHATPFLDITQPIGDVLFNCGEQILINICGFDENGVQTVLLKGVYDPFWSAEGDVLYYMEAGDGETALIAHAADGSARSVVTSFKGAAYLPSLSFDQQRVSWIDDTSTLYVREIASNSTTKVSEYVYGNAQPSWSKSSTSLIFCNDTNSAVSAGVNGIHRFTLELNFVETLIESDNTKTGACQPAWTLDGATIYFIRADASGLNEKLMAYDVSTRTETVIIERADESRIKAPATTNNSLAGWIELPPQLNKWEIVILEDGAEKRLPTENSSEQEMGRLAIRPKP